MSAMSRRKGAAAEREISKLLSDELGISVTRNTDPMRVSGGDILTVPGYSIEVKRCETIRRNPWWLQACRQAERVNLEPIVFFRRNREPWRALVAGWGGPKELTWDEAIDRMRDKAARLYGVYGKEAA